MKSIRSFRPRLEQLESRLLLASLGELLRYDFNGTASWPQTPGEVSPGVVATQTQTAVGTVDVAGGTTNTGGVALAVSAAPASGYWKSELSSGRLSQVNTITNLGLLTLSFDLRASAAKPVKVLVDSFDALNVRTGTLETMIDPAAGNTYQRYAIDFSSMQSSGLGTFDPTGPRVAFRFEVSSQAGWLATDIPNLHLDNVNYSKPAYYVRPFANGGRDTFDGRTELTAFATLQKAIDVSQAGDIILVMNGDYVGAWNGIQAVGWVKQGGAPDAWLSIKNYPGHTPTINAAWTSGGVNRAAWNGIQIGANGSAPSTGPAVAYVEVRGLRIVGNALLGNDPSQTAFRTAADTGQVVALTNNNGISVEGRFEANVPHHIRFADNFLEYLSGGGLGAQEADWVLLENNVVQNTSWWTRYATSGISVFSSRNFDGVDNGTYNRIVRNNIVSGNETKELWQVTPPRFSDGNGIIIDINRTSGTTPTIKGRTLVQGNVAFNNGGSGIHSFKADKVDIFSNTAYLNSASPELQYGQIFANQSIDVKIYNNILVAPVANTAAGQIAEDVNGGTTPNATNGVEYRNNIFWGGNRTPISSTINNNRVMNPLFVNPSINPAVADFRLQPTSPAINAGLTSSVIPTTDILRNVRNGVPDIGAYEYFAATPTIVVTAGATPNPVTLATTTLTVVAGDDIGPQALTYTWSTTAKPVGASDPTFDRNGSNVARTARATFSRAGIYTFNVTVSDEGTNVSSSTVNVTVNVAATPIVVIANGAVQRSMVKNLTVEFDQQVSFQSGAFEVIRRGGTSGTVPVSISTATGSNGQTIATLSFSGSMTRNGALQDGNYELRVIAANVIGWLGVDYNFGAQAADKFYAYFGDTDGDRSVGLSEFREFRSTYGRRSSDPRYNPLFDSGGLVNGFGQIGMNDMLQIRRRLGKTLRFQ